MRVTLEHKPRIASEHFRVKTPNNSLEQGQLWVKLMEGNGGTGGTQLADDSRGRCTRLREE